MLGHQSNPTIQRQYLYTILARHYGGTPWEWKQRPYKEIRFHTVALNTDEMKNKMNNNENQVIENMLKGIQ